MKNLKLFSIMFAMLCIGLTSCGDELSSGLTDAEIIEVENFVDGSISDIQDRVAAGRNGCVEFVFPISVTFADGTSATAEDYETLYAAIKAWKEANMDEDAERGSNRPDLVFPVQVINEEGEIVDIATQEELRAVYQECGGRSGNGNRGKRGHKGRGYSCFSIVYPVTVDFPDGTSEVFEDRATLKAAVKAYKEENPDAEERPTVAYPLTVAYDDGTQATVESRDALKELKEACAEEG